MSNKLLRTVMQTMPEVSSRFDQFGKILAIPDSLKQIGNISQFLGNTQYLDTLVSALDKSGKASKLLKDVRKYGNMLNQMKSSGTGAIFQKVASQQFGIDSNTFTEFENVVQALGNSGKILS